MTNSPVPPAVPTAQELFDVLMKDIEPELTSEGQKRLAEKYANETLPEYAARRQRYELAFAQYDAAYEEYMDRLQTQVERYRRHSFEEVEMEDRQEEETEMKKLDHMIVQFV